MKTKNLFLTIIFFSICNINICGFAQNNSLLLGVWGFNRSENAVFEIKSDSIYYVDEMVSKKYTATNDSLIFDFDGYKYRTKYVVSNDSLIFYKNNKIENRYIRFLESGNFTIQPGYTLITSNITSYGSYASFYLVFFPTSTMSVGTSYRVATVSENCRPLAPRVLSLTAGSRTWSVTINPNGDVYATIVSGSAIIGSSTPTNDTVVPLATLTYNF